MLVEDREYLIEGLARGLACLPTAEGFGHRIHEYDPSPVVRCDDRISDARQHGGKPLLTGLGPSPRGIKRLDQYGDHQTGGEKEINSMNFLIDQSGSRSRKVTTAMNSIRMVAKSPAPNPPCQALISTARNRTVPSPSPMYRNAKNQDEARTTSTAIT